MADYTIKSGDRYDPIDAILKDDAGVVINLTGATVKFIMRLVGYATPRINAAATVVDAAAGHVRYSWAAGDTDAVGNYYAEWEILWPGSLPQTCPTAAYLIVDIVSGLA